MAETLKAKRSVADDEATSRRAKLVKVAQALGPQWTADRVRSALLATAPAGAKIPECLWRPMRQGKRHE